MLFIILSILDVVAGAAIFSSSVASIIFGAISAIALIVLAKGIWTLFSAVTSEYPWHGWSGALDIIAGAALIMITYNILHASQILGGVVMAKGGWYLARSILKF